MLTGCLDLAIVQMLRVELKPMAVNAEPRHKSDRNRNSS